VSATETKGTALITGAPGGIGAIYADRLAKRGYGLILVARNQKRLAALAQRLNDETGRSVETIAADLNDKVDLARIETTLRTNASITLLVNNAGVGATAPLLESDIERMDKMIRLNVGALTRLTYAAAPGFVARGGGTIVNISSSVAISPESLNGSTGPARLSCWPSVNRSIVNSPARTCASKQSCPGRRRRSSGTSPGFRYAIYPRKS
jgi:uncharacterized protein